mgnify:CR=1 FL=1|jgi:hypothetical protein
MANKLPVKDILAAIDMNAREVWDEFSDEEKKSVSFWLLNRYTSSIKGSREKQELAVLKTNEYYNKNYMDISKHPKLQWQLLCLAGNTGKIEYHPWQGFRKAVTPKGQKYINVLSKIYPAWKSDDIERLSKMFNDKELIQLAEDHGIELKL